MGVLTKSMFVCCAVLSLIFVYEVDAMAKVSQITETEAIKIGKEHLQSKKYNYAIDWDHPHARLNKMALKRDGSLTAGWGKRVYVWFVWFLPVEGIDMENTRHRVGVNINAQTGEIIIKYSLNKL